MGPITLRERFREARARTRWFSRRDVALSVIASGIAALAAILVQQNDPDFRDRWVLIPFAAGSICLVGMYLLANGIEFAWNLSRAGDQLKLQILSTENAELTAELTAAKAIVSTPTDAEIIQSLSARAKALMTSFERDLVAGKMGARGFDASVVAQLTELGLATIAYATPPPQSLSNSPIAYLNLTASGARIIQKLHGYKAPREARTSEGWKAWLEATQNDS